MLFLARHPMLDLYTVEGETDGSSLTMLVADDGSTLPYISSVVFPSGAVIRRKGSICALKAHCLIDRKADLIVVGANRLLLRNYARRGFHLIPKWINPYLPLTDHPDALIDKLDKSPKRDITRNLKKAEANGFDYEVTADPAWFDNFYNDMYVPYAQKRYGELAQIDSYERVKQAYTKGAGIIVKQHGKHVGGTIVYAQRNVMRNPYVGISDGDETVAREGASRVLYYYAMLLAHSWGCEGVNFGSTRPFLSDGVLKYKLKWGMQVRHDELSTAVFALAAPGLTKPAQKFLETNPFFRLTKQGYEIFKP